jgi:predicted metal-dependent phosphotriesterase family hydrolase
VLGTGFRRAGWLPPEVARADTAGLVATLVRDLEDGDDERIRAGVIGLIGVSRRPRPVEDRALAAAALAQARTGAGIVIGLEVGAEITEFDRALDILEANGATLGRVAVGGLVARPDRLRICMRLAERGCFILFDTFGQDRRVVMNDLMATPPEVQAASLKGFIDQGLLDRLLVSQGVDHVELFTANGAGGYGHVLQTVLPRARDYQVTPEEIWTLTVANPRRLLEHP